MCGICGRFNYDGRPSAADEIVAMRDVMIHRGPDGQGLFADGGVALGHRRLSIIDLEGGHQPLQNEDETITIVFNGEIYNFQELRKELQSRGHILRTRSDTEVIVHLYEELGTACVERLRGMFAFALWDGRHRRLLLARDRVGIKPLYFVDTGRSLVFASEIKSLLQAEGVGAELDPVGLRRFLAYRHPYGNGTLFKGIRQLPPGHVLIATSSGIATRQYWNVPERHDDQQQRKPAEFLALLEEAVRLRMISDVPVGAFLSGGIDSSVVTALMARDTDRVKTFSIGFVPGDENELSWARLVAESCGADHREFVLGSEDYFSLLSRLVWHHDEPMIFPASIPLYLLSRESKRKATVMLAGEGADEILAGYGNNVHAYWLDRIRSKVPAGVWSRLAALPLTRRIGRFASRAALDDRSIILGYFKLIGSERLAGSCRIPLPDGHQDDEALLDEVGLSARNGTFLDRLLYFQMKTYLVALLMKQDKMSMAASIETRVPYLDHHLVEMAFSLPDNQKVRRQQGKHLLRIVSRGIIPETVINRRKRGFPLPIAQWFREPGSPFIDLLLDHESLRDGLLDGTYVQSRVERFRSGEDLSLELWAIMNLEIWRREYLASQPRMRSVAS